jgi:hypothetical protein
MYESWSDFGAALGTTVVAGLLGAGRAAWNRIPVPEEKWMRCDNAFQPIVSKPLFEAAALVRRFNEKVYVSHEEILRGLRRALRREGRLSAALINRAPELPSAHTVGLRFGTLTQAYEAMGYTPEACTPRASSVG